MIVPGSANPLLIDAPSGYQVSRSVRFRASASAYFNRTLTTPTNNKIWTFSCWFKRGQLTYGASGASGALFFAPSSGSTFAGIYFTPTDIINWYDASGGAGVYLLQTTQVFRDPSAWYHLVCAYDSTQATASDRQKMYINGSLITALATTSYVAQNTNGRFNSAVSHTLGEMAAGPQYFDGYMTEVNFIDGQALTPASFGVTDSVTGVWNPIRYSGTYGNNGFYLNFSDNTSPPSATTIGKDSSGNGNNWTPTGISLTTGTTYDSMVDSPTNYGTDTGAGGEVRGNYAVMNSLDKYTNVTVSNGNLDSTFSAYTGFIRASFVLPSTGKWYWEGTVPTTDVRAEFGIATLTQALGVDPQSASGCWIWYSNGTASFKYNGSGTSWGTAWASGDIIGIAFDAGAGTLTFYKNNTLQGGGAAFTGLTGTYAPMIGFGNNTSTAISINFGQRPFSYTAPSGFKALCTQNMPTPTIGATATTQAGKYFNTIGWQGTGNTGRSFTGVGFKPDLVWAKDRSAAYGHVLFDAVRGAGPNKELGSQSTGAEGYAATTSYDYLNSFDTDGFTSVWSGSNTAAYFNTSTHNYVAWNWKGNNGTTTISVNQYGSTPSKASTVSANQTAGFSIATFQQTTGTFTVGHGLGIAPEFVIAKDLNASNGWICYHIGMDATAPENYYIFLHSAAGRAAGTAAGGIWQATKPSQNLVYFGDTTSWWGASGVNRVMYCFASITGYSKISNFTGNGDPNGTFVYCGFRPRFVMMKRADTTGDWFIFDSVRDPYNWAYHEIYPDAGAGENAGSGVNSMDILSNGFKMRTNSADRNAASGNFIYAAFAENPFNYSRAR